MVKTSLGKSDLQKEKQKLKLYIKILPSLNLKRNQLMLEHAHANFEMIKLKKETEQTMEDTICNLPMIADRDVNLNGLLKVSSLVIVEESIMGVKIPLLKDIQFEVCDYSLLATPFWMEAYIKQLKKVITGKMQVKIMDQRADKLKRAVRRITQHVNLFEKILIPSAKKNIQKIQVLLGEAERSAVVRSKLAKALHMRKDTNNFLEATP